MEDALAQEGYDFYKKISFEGLNPCFNGRCTRTHLGRSATTMQKGLNPCFNGRCTRTEVLNHRCTVILTGVLILVLMEDALARKRNLQTKTLVS